MAAVTVELIKQLRDRTGAGLMDCKKALSETNALRTALAEALRLACFMDGIDVERIIIAEHTAYKLLASNVLYLTPTESVRLGKQERFIIREFWQH